MRNLAGDPDTGKAEALYTIGPCYIQLDAIAWLWPSIDDPRSRPRSSGRSRNRAVETAGAANFTTSYGDGAYVILSCDRRTDGIVLDALITEQPDSDLIPKVVTGSARQPGEGPLEQHPGEHVHPAGAAAYFDDLRGPDARLRGPCLARRAVRRRAHLHRPLDRSGHIAIPTDELIATGDTHIVLGKDGTGRLYYRLACATRPTISPSNRSTAASWWSASTKGRRSRPT